jgi:hypothetical protein
MHVIISMCTEYSDRRLVQCSVRAGRARSSAMVETNHVGGNNENRTTTYLAIDAAHLPFGVTPIVMDVLTRKGGHERVFCDDYVLGDVDECMVVEVVDRRVDEIGEFYRSPFQDNVPVCNFVNWIYPLELPVSCCALDHGPCLRSVTGKQDQSTDSSQQGSYNSQP